MTTIGYVDIFKGQTGDETAPVLSDVIQVNGADRLILVATNTATAGEGSTMQGWGFSVLGKIVTADGYETFNAGASSLGENGKTIAVDVGGLDSVKIRLDFDTFTDVAASIDIFGKLASKE